MPIPSSPNQTGILFQKWKEEGLTKYIGVARHQESYYENYDENDGSGDG